MKFVTSIQCIDGRVVKPLQKFIHAACECEYIDTITIPGVNNVLAERGDILAVEVIQKNLKISVEAHHSGMIFLSGHHDCAANPVPKETQLTQLGEAKRFLTDLHPNIPVRSVYVEEDGTVEEIA